jgi:hypothetical protein
MLMLHMMATFAQMSSVPRVGGFNLLPLIYIALVLAMVVVPIFLGRRASREEPPDPGSDDGPGRGPRRPPPRPKLPLGGLPLPDAVQSRTRLRGNGRIVRTLNPRRERIHEPDRRPIRAPR